MNTHHYDNYTPRDWQRVQARKHELFKQNKRFISEEMKNLAPLMTDWKAFEKEGYDTTALRYENEHIVFFHEWIKRIDEENESGIDDFIIGQKRA